MSQVIQREFFINTEADWKNFWQLLLPEIQERCLFLLSGDVGAGKTTSVRELANLLGLKDVASPSFAIHHRYQNHEYQMDHVDLYRIESEDELEGTGFWDLMSQDKAWIFIEWPSRLNQDHLPLGWQILQFEYQVLPDQRRRIQVLSR